MPRARLLKPGFFTNELLAELPFAGRLLFAGLWTLADKEGRLEDRPRRIKASLFPWDEVDVQALLTALESKGFIDRYMSSGIPLIQIAKFAEHQTPHARETESILPASPTRPGQGEAQPSPRSPVAVPVSDPVAVPVVRTATSAAPPFLTFPTVGKPTAWELAEKQLSEWQGIYPNLDVRSECRKALAWATANQGRRKTARGMPAFLVRWFGNAVDRRHADRPVAQERRKFEYIRPCPHTPPCITGSICYQVQQDEAEQAS